MLMMMVVIEERKGMDLWMGFEGVFFGEEMMTFWEESVDGKVEKKMEKKKVGNFKEDLYGIWCVGLDFRSRRGREL